jgi:hypothetical protein
MEKTILDAFVRDADGAWCCVRAVTLEGPGGRIQVAEGARFRHGIIFMGVDVARFLDAHSRSGGPAEGVSR